MLNKLYIFVFMKEYTLEKTLFFKLYNFMLGSIFYQDTDLVNVKFKFINKMAETRILKELDSIKIPYSIA